MSWDRSGSARKMRFMTSRRIAVKLTAVAAAAASLAAPATAGAAEPDFAFGKIVSGPGSSIVALGTGFDVARLRQDGTLDRGFARDGIASVSFPRYREARSSDAVRLPRGGIVVGGYVTLRCQPRRGQGCVRRPALVRFRRSGRLDPGFGRGGRVLSPRRGSLIALASLPSGKLLGAGRTVGGLPMLVRYTVDGSLDLSFGRHGVVVLRRLPGLGALHFGRVDDVVGLRGGEAIASIFVGSPGVRRRGLVSFGGRGGLRAGFGDAGFATVPPEGARFNKYGLGLATLPDGKLLVAGTTTDHPPRLALFRFSADGDIDQTYGTSGLALGPSSFGVRSNTEVTLQPDGKAVATAGGYGGSALARFESDGALDRSFGSDGMTPPIDSWGFHASVDLLPDGGIVLADSDRQLSGLIVTRYSAAGALLPDSVFLP